MTEILNAVLGRKSTLEVLRCLAREPEEMSGREIARRAGISHLAAHKALSELAAEGLVEKRDAPPAYQFRLNRRHWVVAELLAPMLEKEASWPDRLRDIVTRNLPKTASSVILYGSAAKNRLTAESDIDVLVLAKKAGDKDGLRSHFEQIGSEIYASFHHPLSALVLSEDEFVKQYRSEKPFAKEISYSGRVIAGKLLTETLFEHGAKKDRR